MGDTTINSDGTAYDGRKGPIFVAIGFSAFLVLGGLVALVS